MAELFRTFCCLIAILVMPGALADIVVRLMQLLHVAIFPLMAPERVPHAVAICVTQVWLTLLGVALLGAATHSWFHDRYTHRLDEI